MKPYRWSESYTEATHENDRTIRLMRIKTAMDMCLCSLLDIGLDAGRGAEQKEVLCALHDLLVMGHLHRKYAETQLPRDRQQRFAQAR